jgi:hypothetical protein
MLRHCFALILIAKSVTSTQQAGPLPQPLDPPIQPIRLRRPVDVRAQQSQCNRGKLAVRLRIERKIPARAGWDERR